VTPPTTARHAGRSRTPPPRTLANDDAVSDGATVVVQRPNIDVVKSIIAPPARPAGSDRELSSAKR